MKLTADDFDAWRHNPLTELVFDRFLQAEMNRTKAQHDDEAWSGPLEPARHAALRERNETLEFVRQISFEEIDEWMKEQQ